MPSDEAHHGGRRCSLVSSRACSPSARPSSRILTLRLWPIIAFLCVWQIPFNPSPASAQRDIGCTCFCGVQLSPPCSADACKRACGFNPGGGGGGGPIHDPQRERRERAARLNDEGNKYWSAANLAAAIQKYKEALTHSPDDANIKQNLARVQSAKATDDGNRYWAAKNYAAAAEAYRDALRNDPNNNAARNNLKRLLVDLGHRYRDARDYDAALFAYREAMKYGADAQRFIDLMPSWKASVRASEYGRAGNHDAAIRSWEEAVKYAPNEEERKRYQGLLESARWQKGVALAQQASDEAKKLYDAKNYGAAIQKYKEAVTHNPGNPHGHNALGNAYWGAGDYDAAIRSYQETLRLYPDSEAARKNLSRVQAAKAHEEGNAHWRNKNYDAAIQSYERALQHNPNDEGVKKNLSRVQAAKAREEGQARVTERAPARTSQPRPPHVVFGADGQPRPAEGFRWAKDRRPGELRVELMDGYRIVTGSDPRQVRVERIPAGSPHQRHPNVIYSADGGVLPADGYRWVWSKAKGDVAVEPVPALEERGRRGLRRVLDGGGQLLSAAADALGIPKNLDPNASYPVTTREAEDAVERLRQTFDAGIMNPQGSLRSVTIGARRPPVSVDTPPAERVRKLDMRRDETARERTALEARRETLQAQPRTGENQVELSRMDNELTRLRSQERAYELLGRSEREQPAPVPKRATPPPPPSPPGPVKTAVEKIGEVVKDVVYGEPIIKDAPAEKDAPDNKEKP